MTISEIQAVLQSSFKNGLYIRRPFFIDFEIYINRNGKMWFVSDDLVYETNSFKFEVLSTDWEIVK